MKNKTYVSYWTVTFFLMTVSLVLLSWIANLYGWNSVQSLLSEEGIRWSMNHVISDYVNAPALAIVLVMFMGVGIGVRSGFYDVWRRMFRKGKYLSGKERRALMLSVISGLCYVLVVILSLPFMKSVTDSFYHSPFQKGFFYILSLGLGMMGIIYGYASNRFHRINQVVDGMSFLISRYAEYFVALFFVVQFFSILSYTCFPEWLYVDATIVDVLFQVCCYLPVFMLFLKKNE